MTNNNKNVILVQYWLNMYICHLLFKNKDWQFGFYTTQNTPIVVFKKATATEGCTATVTSQSPN